MMKQNDLQYYARDLNNFSIFKNKHYEYLKKEKHKKNAEQLHNKHLDHL